jgi:hypothetical protein
VLKDQIIESCRYLLLPLVRFLLKQGVTFAEFAELAKEAFVLVAREDYGVQGRPTNNSRVAMLTGISRREVSHIRDRLLEDRTEASVLHGNRISQILSGWHTDPGFLTAAGKPRRLALDDGEDSFGALLKRYAGDLPHGAIRKEMLGRGLIEDCDDGTIRVLKRDYIYSKLDPEILRHMSITLHDHAATLEHNLDEKRIGASRFEGMADNARIPRARIEEFRELVEKRGLAFLEEIDAWLSANETEKDGNAGARSIRLGAGVYLIHDDSQ